MFVTKFDGSIQPFHKEKIVRTCLRMGASAGKAEEISNKIQKNIYDGIPTKKILQMIFKYMREVKPEVRHQIDLREAISLLRSKPDFEHFVGLLLQEYGYRISMNQMVSGKCVEHEIDVIAIKGSESIYVEVKHHLQAHTYTGVDTFLQARATFEDLIDGNSAGKNDIKFTKGLVFCNTKISDHALRYSACSGIDHIGWKSPKDRSLEMMVEQKKLYPITFIRGLDRNTTIRLGDARIYTVKQLVESNLNELSRKSRISKINLLKLIQKSKHVLGY